MTTANCEANAYSLNYTDKNTAPINIPVNSLIQNGALAFFGQYFQQYGGLFDGNILHLLENFACPENPAQPGTPLTSEAIPNIFNNPVLGQLWYNTTNGNLYCWTQYNWDKIANVDDVAGLSGTILSGNQIPLPTSSITNYVFKYSECVWFVSPYQLPEQIEYMECYTDSSANVICNYVVTGGTTVTPAYANFMILGIKNNSNNGVIATSPVGPPIAVTPSPTPNIIVSPTPTLSLSPTPLASVTPSPSLSPTPTPTPSVTPSLAPLSASIIVSPSQGYPNSSGNTTLPTITCSNSADTGTSLIENNILYLQIVGLTGGSGSYTIDYSHVSFSSQAFNMLPQSVSYQMNNSAPEYYGGYGTSTTPVRTLVTSGSNVYATFNPYPTVVNSTDANTVTSYTLQYSITAGSYIIITDAQTGAQLKISTPSGSNGASYKSSTYNRNNGSYVYTFTVNCTIGT